MTTKKKKCTAVLLSDLHSGVVTFGFTSHYDGPLLVESPTFATMAHNCWVGGPFSKVGQVGGGLRGVQVTFERNPDAPSSPTLLEVAPTLWYADTPERVEDTRGLVIPRNSAWIHDYWHWPSERVSQSPDLAEFRRRLTEECESVLPGIVSIIALQRRYLLYYSDGDAHSQRRFIRMAKIPNGFPFNKDGSLSKLLDGPSFNAIHSNLPDAASLCQAKGMRPLIWDGPAWCVRFMVRDRDVLRSDFCRVYLDDDGWFICSDWCQRDGMRGHNEGINLVAGRSYRLPSWIAGPLASMHRGGEIGMLHKVQPIRWIPPVSKPVPAEHFLTIQQAAINRCRGDNGRFLWDGSELVDRALRELKALWNPCTGSERCLGWVGGRFLVNDTRFVLMKTPLHVKPYSLSSPLLHVKHSPLSAMFRRTGDHDLDPYSVQADLEHDTLSALFACTCEEHRYYPVGYPVSIPLDMPANRDAIIRLLERQARQAAPQQVVPPTPISIPEKVMRMAERCHTRAMKRRANAAPMILQAKYVSECVGEPVGGSWQVVIPSPEQPDPPPNQFGEGIMPQWSEAGVMYQWSDVAKEVSKDDSEAGDHLDEEAGDLLDEGGFEFGKGT